MRVVNDLIVLKGDFQRAKREIKSAPHDFKDSYVTDVSTIKNHRNQINDLLLFWADNNVFSKVLVSVHYKREVPKSNMLSILLSDNGSAPYKSIVGARYSGIVPNRHSVITYAVLYDALKESRNMLERLEKELSYIDGYAYSVINDDLEQAVSRVNEIFDAEMMKTVRLRRDGIIAALLAE